MFFLNLPLTVEYNVSHTAENKRSVVCKSQINQFLKSSGIVKVIWRWFERIQVLRIFSVIFFWVLIPQDEHNLPLQVWWQKYTSSQSGQTKTDAPN